MQLFIFPSKIVSEMNSFHTCIRAVLKLVTKLDVDVVLVVAIAITSMKTSLNANVMDFLLNEPPFLHPLPPTQANLPQEIVLHETGIQEDNPHIRLGDRPQSQYFMEKLNLDPFRCIMFAPRIFPQKILGTQVLKKDPPPES